MISFTVHGMSLYLRFVGMVLAWNANSILCFWQD